jgi:hypothetical protein
VALTGLVDALLTVRTSHAPARRCGVANPIGGQRLAPAAAADLGGHHSRLSSTAPKTALFKTAFGCVICVRSEVRLKHGLWPAEDKIVITREGYERPQQWFTSALAPRQADPSRTWDSGRSTFGDI